MQYLNHFIGLKIRKYSSKNVNFVESQTGVAPLTAKNAG